MFDDWITEDVHSVLLVEPNFPIPSKSRNHKNFLPIGLLKIAAYLRTKSIRVKLIRLDDDDLNLVDGLKLDDFKNLSDKLDDFQPDLICVTSIFTYWAKYVKNTVSYLRFKYNGVPILVGGMIPNFMT